MSLNKNLIEQILAMEAGDLNEQEASSIRQSMYRNPEMAELFESWKMISTLIQSDDSVSPPDAVIERAKRLEMPKVTPPVVEHGALASILNKIDGFVARLIHDSQLKPVAIRSGSSGNLHQVWEAGEFDIDIIADKNDQSGQWKLRGQIMSDDNLDGLPVAIVMAGTTNIHSECKLDESGIFTFYVNAGTWGLRIGTETQSVTLEPIAL